MRIRRVCAALVLTFSFLSILPPVTSAQTTSATVTGQITDEQGRVVPGAAVVLTNLNTNTPYPTQTNSEGSYRLSALQPGISRANVSKDGFKSIVKGEIELHVQDQVSINFTLQVGSVSETVTVEAGAPLLNTESATTGAVVDRTAVQNMPLNGRNYLDLLQLVPGVTVNRRQDPGLDTAVPVLGERGGNTNFLIDGLPNRDDLNGGAALQFNQDSIAEFRVDTTGYKAEFGHGSGGVVNVITRSGNNDIHGTASFFHRNNAFDSSDVPGAPDAPFLLRWDYGAALGGPMVKDKAFWFASAERIREVRELNFQFSANTPQVLRDFEASFDQPNTNRETRLFAKLDQIWGRHRFTEEVNATNLHVADFLPPSNSTSLPSTRTNIGDGSLLVGGSDTALLGDSASSWVLSLRGQFRRSRNLQSPAHPAAGNSTFLTLFSGPSTGRFLGDLGLFHFGTPYTPATIHQDYGTFGASLAKSYGSHAVKFGYDFVRTQVDGTERSLIQTLLFATAGDFVQFGVPNSGINTQPRIGGVLPNGTNIRLRNNYSGLFVQDDWRVAKKLTLNLGLRWDYDSTFGITSDISPRVGFAWAVTPRTIVRGSWGYFYDHFRLGLARDIPAFGGANLSVSQPYPLPRLLYGIPSTVIEIGFSPAFAFCASPTLTDAQIAAQGATCPFPGFATMYGVDHLNGVVAPGHALIPADTVVTASNVESLAGLTPEQFADQASLAIGKSVGFFEFNAVNGLLGFNPFFGPGGASFPFSLAPGFATPFTRSLNFGIQRQVTSDMVISLDFYHKDIKDMLGIRQTNLAFTDRIRNTFTGSPDPALNSYGPWFSGTYNAGILSFEKRMSHRFAIGGSYTYASQNDDALCSNFRSDQIAVFCYPTDSFVGQTTLAVDPGTGTCPGGSNATASFFACNGNFVPKASIFYDGPTLDSGASDLSLRHTFEAHGMVQLPWKFEISSLFRVQSGFHYTQGSQAPVDQDGNNNRGSRDLRTGRNAFTSPHFINVDMRFGRTFRIGERMKIQGIFEFFNIFNTANPAAIQTLQGGVVGQPFGSVTQRLPGREGQIGLRITF